MYIGLGILAASLSFLAYKHLSPSSIKPFPYSSALWEQIRGLGLRIGSRSAPPIERKNKKEKEKEKKGNGNPLADDDDDEDGSGDDHGTRTYISSMNGLDKSPSSSLSPEVHGSPRPLPSFTFALDEDDSIGPETRTLEGRVSASASASVSVSRKGKSEMVWKKDEELLLSQLHPSPPSEPNLSPDSLMMPPPPARPASSARRKMSPPATSQSAVPPININPNNNNNNLMMLPPPPPPSTPRSRPPAATPSPQLRRNIPATSSTLTSTSTPKPKIPTRTTLLPPPTTTSQQSLRLPTSSSLSTSTLPPPSASNTTTNQKRKKVILSPGHSPLDWAFLTKHPPTPTFLRGSSVPPHSPLIKVSRKTLRLHNGRKGMDAWGVWRGKVYNLTPYLDFHPGGVGELLRAAGKEEEGERLFMEIHPWVSWDAMLEECLVGVLVGDDDGDGGDDGGDDDGKGEVMWDEMD